MTSRSSQGDHQNKPDVGAGLARQWFDNGVDMLIDVPNSAVGLAIASVAAAKNKVLHQLELGELAY